jgi:hypothetical protein
LETLSLRYGQDGEAGFAADFTIAAEEAAFAKAYSADVHRWSVGGWGIMTARGAVKAAAGEVSGRDAFANEAFVYGASNAVYGADWHMTLRVGRNFLRTARALLQDRVS